MEYAVPHLRLIIAVFVTAAFALTFPYTVMVASSEQGGAVEQRGLVLPAWGENGYRGTTPKAISDIAGLGASWIEFTPT